MTIHETIELLEADLRKWQDKRKILAVVDECGEEHDKMIEALTDVIDILRRVGDVEGIKQIIYQDMKPVLCEKTKTGEWIIPAPTQLAKAVSEYLLKGE